jgi:hypothetical protein
MQPCPAFTTHEPAWKAYTGADLSKKSEADKVYNITPDETVQNSVCNYLRQGLHCQRDYSLYSSALHECGNNEDCALT